MGAGQPRQVARGRTRPLLGAGFDQTTAAEIAKRAGVTERTFFRHFADKREVLFGGSAILRERIVGGVAGAPAGAGALDAVAEGLDAAASMLGEGRRDLAAQRLVVIAANPELSERELLKLFDYSAAVAGTLRERGVSEPQATLAAGAGMTVLRVALERWANGEDDRDLPRSCGRQWRNSAPSRRVTEASPSGDSVRSVELSPWSGPWSDDDPDANFKADVALYAHVDPMATI